jgi:hypothetical protein
VWTNGTDGRRAGPIRRCVEGRKSG